MSIVRPITRPVTRPPTGYVVGGDFDPGLIARRSEAIFDDSDLTSMFVGRDGSGGNAASSGVVGLQLDKSHMGGMTAAAYIASRVEYNSGDDEWTVGTGWALSDGVFTATSVGNTAGNHSVIDAPPTGAGFVKVTLDVTRTSGTLLVKYYKSGTFHGASISSTGSYEFLLNGSLSGAGGVTTYGVTLSGDPAFTGTVSNISIKHIPGQHRTAAADNERPVLDLTNGVYSLDYDGVDDGLSFNFDGGAGPADCSVFFAVKTTDARFMLASLSTSGGSWFGPADDGDAATMLSSNAGLSIGYKINGQAVSPSTRDDLHTLIATDDMQIIEVGPLNLSGWSAFKLSSYGGWKLDGNIIGPIIVETSKLTNALRRTIEQDLKRKAGIQ